MPSIIYTHGDLSAWIDEEAGTLVVKDNRNDIEYDMPSMAMNTAELCVFVFSQLMGTGTPADFGATPRDG